MSASIVEIFVYYLLDIFIYILLKGIHQKKCNGILLDWYNCLVFMKTGCEIKMMETQSDVIWEKKWKT